MNFKHFKMYLGALSTFMMLHNHHCYPFLVFFFIIPNKLYPLNSNSIISSFQSLVTSVLLCVSMDLLILDNP